MKKKLLIPLFILLTGCTLKYEVKFDDKVIKEKIIFNDIENVDQNLFYEQYALKNQLYQIELNNDNVQYLYNYNYNNFSQSLAIKSCFNEFKFIENNNHYSFDAKGFICIPYQKNDYEFYDYDKLEIKFVTNHKVIKNNADLIEGNNYYWYITKDNYDSKKIEFEFEKNLNKDRYILIYIFVFIIVISIVISLILKSKNSKNNKL